VPSQVYCSEQQLKINCNILQFTIYFHASANDNTIQYNFTRVCTLTLLQKQV